MKLKNQWSGPIDFHDQHSPNQMYDQMDELRGGGRGVLLINPH